MAILTISKEFGSGGTQIGQSVAKLLNYEYISLKQIHEDAKQPGRQWERGAEDYAGGASSLWERFDWSFMSFVALSQNLVFKYALKDTVVIMARGGNVLMRDVPYCLRIRVTAPFEKRVETVAMREDISKDLARLIVKKADRELTSALNQMYDGEWDDPATFDFIFNTAQQSLDNVANTVKDACLNKDAFRTDEAVKALQLKAKAYEVKAGIATDPHLLVPTLEVVPQGGGLVVRGVVSSTEEYHGVQDEATRLAGSVPVTFDLHFRGEIKR